MSHQSSSQEPPEAQVSGPQPCQLCQGPSLEAIGRMDRRGRPLATVICRDCGLVQHAEIPSIEALTRYYGLDYRAEYNGERQPSAYRLGREWRRGARLYERLRPYVQPAARVFEIGTGIGCNLKQFELAGHATEGIEPGREFCQFSRDVLHVNVSVANWEDLTATQTNDLVLLVHVLEHLRDPVAALRCCFGLLREDGLLYVEVPNLAAPHAAPHKLFHYAHIFNFTPLTLERACRAAGFELVTRMTSGSSRNLALLARRSNGSVWEQPVASAYQEAMSALQRYSPLSYHLRLSYLLGRIGGLCGHASDRLLGPARRRHILQICADHHAHHGRPSDGRRHAA